MGYATSISRLFFTSEWVRRIRLFPVVFHDKKFKCQKCCHFIYLLKEHGGHIHHFSFPASQRKELLFDHMWSHLHSGSFSSVCLVIDNGFRRKTGSTQSPCVVREEIKERKECLVYFRLLLSYFPRPDRENRYLQVLRNTLGLNSYLGLFAPCLGHFRVPLCLCFKASLSAKPFLWKWIWFAWKWNCMQNSFSYERFCT